MQEILQLDNKLIVYLNSLGSETFDWFWLLITNPIHWIWLPFLTTYYLFKFYDRKQSFQLLFFGFLSCCITLIFVELIKRNIARYRPINNSEIKSLLRIVTTAENYSFVSGHSAFSMTYAVLVYQFLKGKTRFSYLIFIFPALFAYSRLYLGVHFVTDILSGFLLGFFIAKSSVVIFKNKLFKNNT